MKQAQCSNDSGFKFYEKEADFLCRFWEYFIFFSLGAALLLLTLLTLLLPLVPISSLLRASVP